MTRGVFALVLALCAGQNPALAVTGGSSGGTLFPEVVTVNDCTGVLVGQRSVLTGKHCTAGMMSVGVPGVWPSVNADVEWTHPTRDLALACLKEQVSAPHPATLDVGGVAEGEHVVVVGYGRTAAGPYSFAGKVMYTLQWYLSFGADLPQAGASSATQVGSTSFKTQATLQAPAVACAGDSGGPAYRRGSKGVVGIAKQHGGAAQCGHPITYELVEPEAATAIRASIAKCEARG